jgi:hypothetical protein
MFETINDSGLTTPHDRCNLFYGFAFIEQFVKEGILATSPDFIGISWSIIVIIIYGLRI